MGVFLGELGMGNGGEVRGWGWGGTGTYIREGFPFVAWAGRQCRSMVLLKEGLDIVGLHRVTSGWSKHNRPLRRYHSESHENFRKHLTAFLLAYNYAKRLKALQGLTPYEFIRKCWTSEPQRFKSEPGHHILGPYT